MHGSPCQDFIRVCEKKGGIKGTGRRSSLLFKLYEELKMQNINLNGLYGKILKVFMIEI